MLHDLVLLDTYWCARQIYQTSQTSAMKL